MQKRLNRQNTMQKWFDPSEKNYSNDPASESYQKRLSYYREDKELAKELLEKFKQK